MIEWIKIEDELPSNLELVDCWIGNEGRRIPDCQMVDGKWHYFSEYGEYEYNPDFYPLREIPTHWRRLPEPPK